MMASGLTLLFALVMVVAMAWDAATLTIPDMLSVTLVAGFVVGAVARSAGWEAMLGHAGGRGGAVRHRGRSLSSGCLGRRRRQVQCGGGPLVRMGRVAGVV